MILRDQRSSKAESPEETKATGSLLAEQSTAKRSINPDDQPRDFEAVARALSRAANATKYARDRA